MVLLKLSMDLKKFFIVIIFFFLLLGLLGAGFLLVFL